MKPVQFPTIGLKTVVINQQAFMKIGRHKRILKIIKALSQKRQNILQKLIIIHKPVDLSNG